MAYPRKLCTRKDTSPDILRRRAGSCPQRSNALACFGRQAPPPRDANSQFKGLLNNNVYNWAQAVRRGASV